MVLTSRLLNTLSVKTEYRDSAIVKTLLGDLFGMVPGARLSAQGLFAKGNLEVPALKCFAMLPSGRFLDIDEDAVFPMPKLGPGEYYFSAGLGKEQVEFECEGTSMVRPAYEYAVLTFEELKEHDMLPLIRLTVADGKCSIDENYIAPCLAAADDGRIAVHCTEIADRLEAVISHVNMDESRGKHLFIRYGVQLRNMAGTESLHRLVYTLSGLADTLDHFIFSHSDSCEDIPPFSCFDLEKWMQWLKGYVESAAQALDSLELEKREIDVEALKAQIEEDLTDKLKPELSESIAAELRDTLTREIEASIEDKLREFIDGTFAARTHDTLKEELQGELNAALYESLYKALYDALYTPPKDESEGFTPLI